jgi:hypothetical protein
VIRFALCVTAVEIALTIGASLWITLLDTGEPYVTPEEFGALGIPVEEVSTKRQSRFGAVSSYDTKAVVREDGPSILVSVSINTPRAEYDSRKAGERFPKLKEGDEPPLVIDESWAVEPGYAVRQTGRASVRSEIVRLRGKDMLTIRLVWKDIAGKNKSQAVSYCEHFARLIQDHMVEKLGWRDSTAPATASPR